MDIFDPSFDPCSPPSSRRRQKELSDPYGERTDRRQWRKKGGKRVAAVDKIEEERKPEDFIGHRNRKSFAFPLYARSF